MKKTTKRRYRVHNWPEYNKSLVDRGRLSLWIDQETIDEWYESQPSGRPGASKKYSDKAILLMLTLQATYRVPLRQTCGLTESIFEAMGVDVEVPDYTTLCRRRGTLQVDLDRPARTAAHVVIDATGLKLYGDGEWHVRRHGPSKRRMWRKVHLCVDERTLEILSVAGTSNAVGDSEMLPELLDQVDGTIDQVSADGAYDTHRCYDAIAERGARAVIPPRRSARITQHGNSSRQPLARDENIRGVRRHGRAEWKRRCGYHRRSLAETTMYRYKTIFGRRLQSRELSGQIVEMQIKCRVLNRMAQIGLPDSRPMPP